MKRFMDRIALIVLLAAAHPGVWAQSSPSSATPSAPASVPASVPASAPASAPASVPGPAAASALSEAEVRRIDAANNRITQRHGPIPNLEMPPMTMQFQVRDAALLQGLQEGSRIRFAAERINGQYTVTVVQPAP